MPVIWLMRLRLGGRIHGVKRDFDMVGDAISVLGIGVYSVHLFFHLYL